MTDLTIDKKLDIIISKLAKIESKVNRLDTCLTFPDEEEIIEEIYDERNNQKTIDINEWPKDAVERLLADIIQFKPANKSIGNVINVDFGKDNDD